MIQERSIHANGITFGYLEAGEGPLVLLLHGFPDNAWTWRHQVPALAGEGFRAVAPFLRGYPPTEVPQQSPDTESLAHDAAALIEALGESSAFVVGHDWGGLATFNVAALHEQRVDAAVSVAVGHPGTALSIFKIPAQLHYTFHVWLFQLEGLAEIALTENDHQLIDYLWRHWSFQPVDESHIERVKQTFRQPGVVEAALAYYRALVRVPSEKPDFFKAVSSPTEVPFMVVYGAEDPARALSEDEGPFFEGPYERVIVGGAGHFVHSEKPEEFTELLLSWLHARLASHAIGRG